MATLKPKASGVKPSTSTLSNHKPTGADSSGQYTAPKPKVRSYPPPSKAKSFSAPQPGSAKAYTAPQPKVRPTFRPSAAVDPSGQTEDAGTESAKTQASKTQSPKPSGAVKRTSSGAEKPATSQQTHPWKPLAAREVFTPSAPSKPPAGFKAPQPKVRPTSNFPGASSQDKDKAQDAPSSSSSQNMPKPKLKAQPKGGPKQPAGPPPASMLLNAAVLKDAKTRVKASSKAGVPAPSQSAAAKIRLKQLQLKRQAMLEARPLKRQVLKNPAPAAENGHTSSKDAGVQDGLAAALRNAQASSSSEAPAKASQRALTIAVLRAKIAATRTTGMAMASPKAGGVARGSLKVGQASDEQKADWAKRVSITPITGSSPQEHAVTIEMAELGMSDAEMTMFVIFFGQLLRQKQPVGVQSRVCFRAKVVDFSGNSLKGIGQLCSMFENHAMTVEVLKLSNNELDDNAVKDISRHLTSYNQAPVHELHLSHNQITAQGIRWLLACFAMHPAYPVWNEKENQFVPIWLPIEGNPISEQEAHELLSNIEELDISVRLVKPDNPAELLFDGRKHNCVAHLHNLLDDEDDARPLALAPHCRPIFAASKWKHKDFPPATTATFKRQMPSVIYEDKDIAVIFKPAGWVCSHESVTPQMAALPLPQRQGMLKVWLTQDRPVAIHGWICIHFGSTGASPTCLEKGVDFGLAHRLDVNTSGPLLVGKTPAGYHHCKQQIHKRDVLKDYLCLVHGALAVPEGECRAPIDDTPYKSQLANWCVVNGQGRPAISIFEALAQYENPKNGDLFTLVHLRIVTGRTHQIRVHMTHLGHSLVGDPTYVQDPVLLMKDSQLIKRIFLHKFRIGFFNAENKVIVRACTLRMANDLWETLGKLRRLGGKEALGGCDAPKLQESEDEEEPEAAAAFSDDDLLKDDPPSDGEPGVASEPEPELPEPDEGAKKPTFAPLTKKPSLTPTPKVPPLISRHAPQPQFAMKATFAASSKQPVSLRDLSSTAEPSPKRPKPSGPAPSSKKSAPSGSSSNAAASNGFAKSGSAFSLLGGL